MNNLYKKIQADLTSKEKFHIKLGLERISEILSLLGNPQDKIKTIHVAGTNGKGSVCSMLAKILENSGYKVGLYTSPHLIKYNERIKISSTDISDDDFSKYFEKVNSLTLKQNIPLTEFEILTATAFLYFCEKKIDIAIIEVGLGGRLDATNVINPILEIITSISLDHTERLGETIEKIAAEKAGIIKKDSIIVTNLNNNGIETIKKIAIENNAQIKIAPKTDYTIFQNGINEIKIDEKIYRLNLPGNFQGENLALVIKAIEILKEKGFQIQNIEKSLLTTFWPARMQFLTPNVILDGAHNPSAAKSLRQTLDNNFSQKKRVWFFGALKNKDFAENCNILFQENEIIYFVKFNSPNSCTDKEFAQYLGLKNRHFITINDFLPLYKNEIQKDNLVIICGSLYLAGEILALLTNQ